MLEGSLDDFGYRHHAALKQGDTLLQNSGNDDFDFGGCDDDSSISAAPTTTISTRYGNVDFAIAFC
jgi:hypothetical protein